MTTIAQQYAGLSPEKQRLLEKFLKNEGLTAWQLPIARQKRESSYVPLSLAQQRLWLLSQLDPTGALYTIPTAIRLTGALETNILQLSINQIVRRHEILRTTFAIVGEQPMQVIAPELQVPLIELDLTQSPGEEREARARQLMDKEAKTPFDLTCGPLLRTTLLKLDEEKYMLLLTMHHIIFDGWSMDVFLGEVSKLYASYHSGEGVSLPALPIQYADFALWQRNWLSENVMADQFAYWREQLKGAPPLLTLPTDRPRPPVQTFRGGTQSWELSPNLSEKLKALSQKEGVTLFMLLLAAFKALLWRYTGQDDIIVGSPTANRTRAELEELIGFFVNLLVLRTRFSENLSFREVLKQVREVALGAYAHQDVLFDQLVAELRPERDLSYSPLFQIQFAFESAQKTAFKLPGLEPDFLQVESEYSKFDLTLEMVDAGHKLHGRWEYNADLFDAATITRLTGHLQTLLEGIVADPSQRIAELPLITAAEAQHIVSDWNATDSPHQGNVCVHTMFEQQVERAPQATALCFTEKQITYHELNQSANQIAHFLQKEGVRPDMLVGICMERSLEMIIAILGVLKAGGAYVPLDPKYPQERLAFMLQDAQIPFLLTQRHLTGRLPANAAMPIYVDLNAWTFSSESTANPDGQATADNLAYVIYTSGSTGRPKGTLVTHRGIYNLALAQSKAFRLQSSSKVLQFASFSFDASVSEIFMTLLSGATLHLGMHESLLPGSALVQFLREQAITCVTLPPSILTLLPQEELSTVQTIIVAGEACPLDLMKQWAASHQLFNAYGPTETTVCATIAECTPDDQNVIIGCPLPNMQIYIVDPSMHLVPPGIVGEILIGGSGLARGYLHRAELTAERFLPDPFGMKRGGRLYRTGDLGRYLPDGTIEYLCRKDDQVKIRGFRIEPSEIASALMRHPSVEQGIVVVREDTPGDKRLVAYIVPQTGEMPVGSELRQFLATTLPEYMLPSAFVQIDTLPLTPNGKLDRKALPSPAETLPQQRIDFVAARDPLEQKLTQMWEDILDTRPISITDDFFELGGHSILALRLIGEIQRLFKQRFSISILFEGRTIEQLAALLRQRNCSLLPSPIVSIQAQGAKRPLFCVHPGSGNVFCYYALAHQLGNDQPLYGLQDPDIYQESYTSIPIEDMAARYIEALRTIQPHGPYSLAGYSFGGTVAFEMAKQLQESGQEIACLAIFDGAAPATPRSFDDEDDALWLAIITLELIRDSTKKELAEMYADLRKLELKAQLDYVLEQLQQAHLNIAEADPRWVYRRMQVFKSRTRVVEEYTPSIYSGKIVLFRAREQDDFVLTRNCGEDQIIRNWSKFTRQTLDVCIVPGYHDTMLAEHNVPFLVEQLQQHLP